MNFIKVLYQKNTYNGQACFKPIHIIIFTSYNSKTIFKIHLQDISLQNMIYIKRFFFAHVTIIDKNFRALKRKRIQPCLIGNGNIEMGRGVRRKYCTKQCSKFPKMNLSVSYAGNFDEGRSSRR